MIFIDITEECNLSCKHCYITQNKGVISLNILKKFLKFLKQNNLLTSEEKICFIGGEPLLYKEILRDLINLVKEKYPELKIEVSSNLSFPFNEIKDIIIDPKVMVHTSLDGTKSTHNKTRVLKEGNSFELVIENLKELVKYKDQIQVIYTFNPNHEERNFVEFVKLLLEINPSKWKINLRPASPLSTFENSGWVFEEVKRLTNFWIEKYNEGININLNLISGALTHINNLRQPQQCGIGYTSFNLKPNGDLWPCSQYYIVKKRKIGNFCEDSFEEIEKGRKKLLLYKAILYEKYKEKDCDCFLKDKCIQVPCPALFEESNYRCDENQRVNVKIVEEVIKILKNSFSLKELSKIEIKGDYLE
jgi:uncharacterized protein